MYNATHTHTHTHNLTYYCNIPLCHVTGIFNLNMWIENFIVLISFHSDCSFFFSSGYFGCVPMTIWCLTCHWPSSTIYNLSVVLIARSISLPIAFSTNTTWHIVHFCFWNHILFSVPPRSSLINPNVCLNEPSSSWRCSTLYALFYHYCFFLLLLPFFRVLAHFSSSCCVFIEHSLQQQQ